MFNNIPFKTIALMFVVMTSVAACKSTEERVQEHYERGLELADQGDVDRAIVEFRNVFQLDGQHKDARLKLADLLLNERKNRSAAYSQYLRLVEQYPDDLESRIILSELAFLVRNWDEVDRHGEKAKELAPDDPRVSIITLARTYRSAAIDQDSQLRREQAENAEALLESNSDNPVLRNILIDSFLRDEKFTPAIEQLDWLLDSDPSNPLYWRQRLSILVELGDSAEIEGQLRRMVEQFPEDNAHKLSLVRYFMSREEVDKAEAFLRELVDAAEPGEAGARLDLIRFLSETRDTEAALAETRKAIAEAEDPVPFHVMGAGLQFSAGLREEAVATLEDVLKTSEPSEQTRGIKVSLARMLLALGNEVGARAHVEEVLAEDASNTGALKMQAAWLIESDETDQAIGALRIVLESEPDDNQALNLMARAYIRAGRPELANDFLSLAVDASNNAPTETLRYAQVLSSQENYLAAEDILKKSLRLNEGNVQLLVAMGRLYINLEDNSRAEQIARALRQIGGDEAIAAANGLEAEGINRNNGPEEAMAFLEDIAKDSDASLATRVSLIRARIGTGDRSGALELAKRLAEESPDNLALQSILATTHGVNGNLEEAAEIYRSILDENPTAGSIWLAYAQIKTRQGAPDDARAVIEEGLGQDPDNANLLWARASFQERDGDFDGAIDVYSKLYEQDSNSIVVANNLASMLSTYRDDEASLERAHTISRRFRDTEIPALQDTYGWIAHRRGESQEALPYLESAARGLQNDPIVQYHLAQVYLALGRQDEALVQFRRAIEVAAAGDARPQIVEAKQQIEALQSAQN